MATTQAKRRLAGTAVIATAGTAVASRRQTTKLDSVYQEPHNKALSAWSDVPNKTLAFPRTMVFGQTLTVTRSEQVNHDTKRIAFKLPVEEDVSGVAPGGAILTQHTPAGALFPVVRPYSPIHDLDERGVLELLVKNYPNGRASGYLHSLSPGDQLTVRGPIPSYKWKASPTSRHVLLVAGGAGITPIFSLTKGILSNPQDRTNVSILWGVNSSKDIVLEKELESLQAQHPGRLQITYCVSGKESQNDQLRSDDKFRRGYIDQAVLQSAIGSIKQKSWGDAAQGTKVFFCGPPAMQKALAGRKGLLTTGFGLSRREIHIF